MSTREDDRSRQLSASDWARAATEAIVAGGVASVAIEPLAAGLGTTKGSFYHHFENRDALIVAALEQWERSETESVIQRMELIADPAERLRAIVAAALADRVGAIRDAAFMAAATHPLVHPVVKRVTDRRLSYMTDLCIELGLPRAQARRRVLLLYTSYLGLFDYIRVGLGADFSQAELRAYTDELLTALVPSITRR